MMDDAVAAPPKKSLPELAAELAQAQDRYEEADTEASRASRDRTYALNHLNQAQKAFDAAVAELRKSAPSESDWARSNRG